MNTKRDNSLYCLEIWGSQGFTGLDGYRATEASLWSHVDVRYEQHNLMDGRNVRLPSLQYTLLRGNAGRLLLSGLSPHLS